MKSYLKNKNNFGYMKFYSYLCEVNSMKLKVHFYEQFKECPYNKCEFFKYKTYD